MSLSEPNPKIALQQAGGRASKNVAAESRFHPSAPMRGGPRSQMVEVAATEDSFKQMGHWPERWTFRRQIGDAGRKGGHFEGVASGIIC